jgi:hypothetical protein
VRRSARRRPAPRRGRLQQLAHQRVAPGVAGRAALLDLAQAVVQRVDQQAAPLGVVQQVVFEVGVALHHPDVAQHLVEHAGRAAGAALLAQLAQQLPGARAQQAQHDLAVGERGVVVGDLAQAGRGSVGGAAPAADISSAWFIDGGGPGERGVHGEAGGCYRSAA